MNTSRRTAVLQLLMCMVLPALVAWGMYHAQKRNFAQVPGVVTATALGPSVRWRIDSVRSENGYFKVRAMVRDSARPEAWLRPRVVFTRPDGSGARSVHTTRLLDAPVEAGDTQRFAHFRAQIAERHVPAGSGSRIFLAIRQPGGDVYIDTGRTLGGSPP